MAANYLPAHHMACGNAWSDAQQIALTCRRTCYRIAVWKGDGAMSLRMRIYYNAVCGALGGLLAWALSGLLLATTTTSFSALLVHDAFLGALAGICIGG